MSIAKGFVAPGFEWVALEFQRQLEAQKGMGSAVCVFHKGRCVVDLWGGNSVLTSKTSSPVPWNPDTLANVYSCTKPIGNSCIAHLVQKGLCSYDDKVSKFWKDFGAAGKESLTITQLLSHQCGVSHIGPADLSTVHSVDSNDLQAWSDFLAAQGASKPKNEGQDEKSLRVAKLLLERIAAQVPHWPVDDERHFIGYHPISIGFYVSVLVSLIDPRHRSVAQYFEEELNSPLGLDFYIGLPQHSQRAKSVADRLAKLYNVENDDGQFNPPIESSVLGKTPDNRDKFVSFERALTPQAHPEAPYFRYKEDQVPGEVKEAAATFRALAFSQISNFSPWRSRFSELPSGIGFGSARSLARFYQLVSEAARHQRAVEEGRESTYSGLFDPKTMFEAVKPETGGWDLVLQQPRAFTKGGFMCSCTTENPGSFYHPGSGGSLGWGDFVHEIGFGFVSNSLQQFPIPGTFSRSDRLVRAVYFSISRLSSPSARL